MTISELLKKLDERREALTQPEPFRTPRAEQKGQVAGVGAEFDEVAALFRETGAFIRTLAEKQKRDTPGGSPAAG